MIKAVCREDIFEMSKMADVAVAQRQRFYFDQFNEEDPDVILSVLPTYDHKVPTFNTNAPDMEFCVIVYDKELYGSTYENGFAAAFVKFLKSLAIEQIILMQDHCRAWDTFGFDEKKDLVKFNKLAGAQMGTNGFLINHSSLSDLLPLLFYNNPDEGDCSFYTASGNFQLGILFWKGNLHVQFYKKDLPKLLLAAKEAKLVPGNRELSLQYRFGKKY